ncbi:MAG: hypothetical protein FWG70_01170 [Oscillospiraceae bacterium]|nr:hypothetical protein [Oscillospiraceae bacterium]
MQVQVLSAVEEGFGSKFTIPILIMANSPQLEVINMETIFENWDGQPCDLTDEDRAWLDMEPVGKERFWEEE